MVEWVDGRIGTPTPALHPSSLLYSFGVLSSSFFQLCLRVCELCGLDCQDVGALVRLALVFLFLLLFRAVCLSRAVMFVVPKNWTLKCSARMAHVYSPACLPCLPAN